MTIHRFLFAALFFAAFALGAASASDDGAADIVESIEESRVEEEGETARDAYLKKKYTTEETIIVRTPDASVTKTVEVLDDREPPPLQAVDLDAP